LCGLRNKNNIMGKTIKMEPSSKIDSLLAQLEELTDPASIHYDKDIHDEKSAIRMQILCGEISAE